MTAITLGVLIGTTEVTDNVILFQRAIDFSWTKSATDLGQGSSSTILHF